MSMQQKGHNFAVVDVLLLRKYANHCTWHSEALPVLFLADNIKYNKTIQIELSNIRNKKTYRIELEILGTSSYYTLY